MLRFQWTKTTIQSRSDFEYLKHIVDTVHPKVGALDTETDGLHIINSKPFVVQFGFLDIPHKQGFTFAIDLENTGFVMQSLFWK